MTDEQRESWQLHGRKATIVAILLAEAMVVGPMIALLPHWMAFWEPRFVGLLMMTMAAPFVILLPTTLRARVAEAVAEAERRRSAVLTETAANRDLIPDRKDRKP